MGRNSIELAMKKALEGKRLHHGTTTVTVDADEFIELCQASLAARDGALEEAIKLCKLFRDDAAVAKERVVVTYLRALQARISALRSPAEQDAPQPSPGEKEMK